MAAEEKVEAPTSTPPSGNGNKVITILTIVNLVATLGMCGVLLISLLREKKQTTLEDIAAGAAAGHESSESKHGDAESKEGSKKLNFGKMINLEQFTVNLSTPGSINPKFARVNISIEVPNSDTEAEANQKMPQVRNMIIDLFNSKRPSDLATAEGRDYLKEEIKNALNGFMVTGKVKGVFFTNFAVSS